MVSCTGGVGLILYYAYGSVHSYDSYDYSYETYEIFLCGGECLYRSAFLYARTRELLQALAAMLLHCLQTSP